MKVFRGMLTVCVALALFCASSPDFNVQGLAESGSELSGGQAEVSASSRTEFGEPGEVSFFANPDNTVAQEIYGTWILDAEASAALLGEPWEHHRLAITFERDEEAEARVRQSLESKLAFAERQDDSDRFNLRELRRAFQSVFLSGKVVWTVRAEGSTDNTETVERVQDFALYALDGNTVLFTRQEIVDPVKEARNPGMGTSVETQQLTVTVVQDKLGDDDLLCIQCTPLGGWAMYRRLAQETAD